MDNYKIIHFTEDYMKEKKEPKKSIKNNLNVNIKNHENKKINRKEKIIF